MPKRTMNPLAAMFLRNVAQVAGRALGAAVDSVLEDLQEGAEEVTARTTRARERIKSNRRKPRPEEDP